MNIQRTLVILKPEVFEYNLVGKILDFYDNAKLRYIAVKQLKPNREQMRQHYLDLVGRYSDELIEDILTRMTRGDCIFIVFEDIDVIKKVRTINGATDPSKAAPGTIRDTFAKSINYNLVHGSDSLESSQKEIKLWFPEL